MKKIAGAALLLLASTTVSMAGDEGVVGRWKTEEDKSVVEIAKCDGEKYCGTILSLKEPNDDNGNPKKDINNQDKSKQDRPIVGMKILSRLEKTSPTTWEDGDIYNPEDGNTYNAEMRLKDANTLEVEGCFLFLCKSQVWKRDI